MVEEGGVTEVATWNDNGSSYSTQGDKGIMILARIRMMLMVTDSVITIG